MDMKGKVALVTGAGSGIGRACADRLAEAGAKVVALGRTESELDEIIAAIRAKGGEALCAVADVSDEAALRLAVRSTLDAWGRIDVVVANAGVNGVWAPLEDLTREEWDRTLAINLTGAFLTIQACLPQLKRRGGSVVIVSSINGTRVFSNSGATAYAVSKAGQVALAKMLSLELAPSRVRVNVVCPGAVKTNIDANTEKRGAESIAPPIEFPEGEVPLRDGDPGESNQVARLVHFLASDASDLITGTEVWIDGGESLLRG